METIVIEINKRTKAGKNLLEFLKTIAKTNSWINLASEKNPISKKEPNAETLRSMEKTKKRIGLTRCDNAEDMYKKLGI